MIKKHMDEAPIIEAFDSGCACPLCKLESDCEKQYVSQALGSGVMEPSRRIEVNLKGFCERHFKLLYESPDRLPLALMIDTHMGEVISAVENEKKNIKRFRRKKPVLFHTCQICDSIEFTMSRYESTLIYMYLHDESFKKKFLESKGVCVRHLERLLNIAPADFAQSAIDITLNTLTKIRSDAHWYTLKFDYRNRDKPWGDSTTAIYRAIGVLRSNRDLTPPET